VAGRAGGDEQVATLGRVGSRGEKQLAEAHAATLATGRYLRRTLAQLEGKKGKGAARKTIRALIKSNKVFASLRLDSDRFLSRLWNGATRGRSLAKLETTRQVIRGSRARVYLKLTFRDGTVEKGSEPLVRHRGTWRLG
jgi:hypothetical protein